MTGSRPLYVVDDGGELGGAQLALLKSLPVIGKFSPTFLTLKDGPETLLLRQHGRPVHSGLLTMARKMSTKSSARDSLSNAGTVLSCLRALLHHTPANALFYANSLQAAILCGLVLRVRSGSRMIWHVRDAYTEAYLPSRALRSLVAWLLSSSRVEVIANSRYTASLLRRPSTVVYSPIDAHFFDPCVPLPASPGLRIVMVGRLDPWKGQHILLQALATPELRDATLEIAGSVMPGRDEYAAGLRREAAEVGISSIRFLGHVDGIRDVIDDADVLVHATMTPEPFGQVVLQGMARGRAVVATAGGGPGELITDAVDGLLYDAGDWQALRRCLVTLDGDRARVERLGAAARERAQDYAPDRQLETLCELIATAVG